MFKFKAIKPGPYNDGAANSVLREQMLLLGGHIKESFDRVTGGWQGSRPEWKVGYSAGGTRVSIKIELANTSSEGGLKWIWLDEGTKAHQIPNDPISQGPLFFMGKYSAGSSVGSLTTYHGESGGSRVGPIRQVIHPGIKARGWTTLLQTDWEKPATAWAEGAFREVAKATGHAKE